MRRWTDGKSWSASRVSGSFLTYREMEGKRGGTSFAAPRSNRDGMKGSEHESADDGPDGYRYKPDGLMKQSFSITTSTGQHLHLISYFARSSTVSANLQQPSNDSQLRHIRPEKGMYPESTVHEQNSIPAVTRGPMTSPAFVPSPHQSTNMGAPYGRGQPHAPHYPMSYGPPGWAPPSPMHTPPPYSPYYHHAAHQHHPSHAPQHSQHPSHMSQHSPHPSASVGHSPLQHMHSYSSHPQHYPPPLTAFDRAPAPLTNNTTLPPPPPHTNQMPPIQNGHLPKGPNHSYPLPSVSSRPPMMSEHSSYRGPAPSSVPIDPSLTGPPSQDGRQDYTRHTPSDTSAGSQARGDTSHRPPPQTATSATTIPSISSLIHETSAGAPPPHRGSSHSPNGSHLRHAQDIPIHKMGYDPARDVQALRHLDKATLRF